MFPPHLGGEQTGVVGTGPGEASFRPIRTPEQIAAEERLNKAMDLYGAVMNHSGKSFKSLPVERQEHYLSLIDNGWQRVDRA